MKASEKIVVPAVFTGGLIGIFTNDLLLAASIAVVSGLIFYAGLKNR